TVFRLIINYFNFIYKLSANRYDLVHVNPSLARNSFYRDLIFIFLARLLGVKVLVFFHGWYNEYEQKIKDNFLKSFLFKSTYAKADKFIVLSQIFKDKLIGLGVPSETEFFIETTVAESYYVNELNLEEKFKTFEEKVIILFIARIEEEKGVYIAINAFQDFLTRCPNREACLIVAGDGPDLLMVKKYVTAHNIPHVKFTGYIRGNMKKEVILSSHIMLFPTYYAEGLPISVLEGMLYGMPVISRINGGIADVIHQNINGYITESKEPSVFADYLTTLASNGAIYKKIAKNNHLTALEKYTSNTIKERILNIYHGFNKKNKVSYSKSYR
ncbi:MAG TPA: glycosyltransferase family 4 protein, partial [Chitinophagaceae bacterium]|nr:glycosyltransferase family 4 protein [Chitinophagaceae bacterium]